jgi:ABC-type uncharacterized transport system permease subunit
MKTAIGRFFGKRLHRHFQRVITPSRGAVVARPVVFFWFRTYQRVDGVGIMSFNLWLIIALVVIVAVLLVIRKKQQGG